MGYFHFILNWLLWKHDGGVLGVLTYLFCDQLKIRIFCILERTGLFFSVSKRIKGHGFKVSLDEWSESNLFIRPLMDLDFICELLANFRQIKQFYDFRKYKIIISKTLFCGDFSIRKLRFLYVGLNISRYQNIKLSRIHLF